MSNSVDVSPSVQANSIVASPDAKQVSIVPSKRGRPRQVTAQKSSATNTQSPDPETKAQKRQKKENDGSEIISFLTKQAIQSFEAKVNDQHLINDMIDNISRKKSES